MSTGDFFAGAFLALGIYLFGKHEDEIMKYISNKLRDFNQTKDPEKRREIAVQLKNDPKFQELFKLMQETK